MKSRKVLAVTTNFPSPRFPEKGVFVRNILLEMTRQNADVDVIAPLSWVAGLKTLFKPKQKVNLSPLNVQQPMITTFSLRFGKFIYKFFMWLNDLSFNRGVRRSINHDTKYDFCYCHFLRSGLAVVDLLKSKNTPIVLNVGESNLSVYDNYYGSEWIEKLSDFDHILAVSKENRDILLKRNPLLEKNIHYVPNGVNTNIFHPRDKLKCREKLHIDLNKKIVVFVGHFIERKGVQLVSQAISRLGIYGIFLGQGPLRPVGEYVLYAGSVVNEELPYWLSSADVFILPSKAEGMSNAILEAMACGLPLIVSDLEFNHEFLDSACAEFINPVDIDDICSAIEKVFSDNRQKEMSESCVKLSKKYTIENRIRTIFGLVDGNLTG